MEEKLFVAWGNGYWPISLVLLTKSILTVVGKLLLYLIYCRWCAKQGHDGIIWNDLVAFTKEEQFKYTAGTVMGKHDQAYINVLVILTVTCAVIVLLLHINQMLGHCFKS